MSETVLKRKGERENWDCWWRSPCRSLGMKQHLRSEEMHDNLCVSVSVWPVWKLKLLVNTSWVVVWLYCSCAYVFFNYKTLVTQSPWQLHYILGGGMWSGGNFCYITGPLSGNGEQWWIAPVWKTLGLREKNAQKVLLNIRPPKLKQSLKESASYVTK